MKRRAAIAALLVVLSALLVLVCFRLFGSGESGDEARRPPPAEKRDAPGRGLPGYGDR